MQEIGKKMYEQVNKEGEKKEESTEGEKEEEVKEGEVVDEE